MIAALAAHVAAHAKIDAVSRQLHADAALAAGPARVADQHAIQKLLSPRMQAGDPSRGDRAAAFQR